MAGAVTGHKSMKKGVSPVIPRCNQTSKALTPNLFHREREIERELSAGVTDWAAFARPAPGGPDFTVFGVSGWEAVDLAVKTARATGRPGIVSARGGYHGHTDLAMAAGDPKYRVPFGSRPPGFTQAEFGLFHGFRSAS
jgi:acetylornithine/succinyldiaminopimelate/putrescine aminotransferase